MNRRTFNELVGLGVLGSVGRPHGARAFQATPAEVPARIPRWPDETFRRSLIDMHVPDWDPALLSKFDAADIVKTIAGAGFQSMMPYGNSHVGLSYWRTKIGQMHRNMRGRDFFGEIVEERKRYGLYAVAYYCLIYDNWAYEYHPDWRMVPDDDSIPSHPQRYGFACPNSPYREHALACLRELMANYDFEGIFVDMPFWPDVCYCAHCTERFRREEGAEPPRIVDWDDPTWQKVPGGPPALDAGVCGGRDPRHQGDAAHYRDPELCRRAPPLAVRHGARNARRHGLCHAAIFTAARPSTRWCAKPITA